MIELFFFVTISVSNIRLSAYFDIASCWCVRAATAAKVDLFSNSENHKVWSNTQAYENYLQLFNLFGRPHKQKFKWKIEEEKIKSSEIRSVKMKNERREHFESSLPVGKVF